MILFFCVSIIVLTYQFNAFFIFLQYKYIDIKLNHRNYCKDGEKMQLSNLNTKFVGRNVSFYNEIDSTQAELWRRVHNNSAINGMLIMADLQSNGVGTHGRTWHTDSKNNIAFSLIIMPNCSDDKINGLTLDIANIIVRILKEQYKIELEIKYPNDLMANNRKVGGILTQTKLKGNEVTQIVVGIGLNTSQEKFNNMIEGIASSIKNEFHIDVDRNKIISQFCNEFEKNIIQRIGE